MPTKDSKNKKKTADSLKFPQIFIAGQNIGNDDDLASQIQNNKL